jgi:hypothetical protein
MVARARLGPVEDARHLCPHVFPVTKWPEIADISEPASELEPLITDQALINHATGPLLDGRPISRDSLILAFVLAGPGEAEVVAQGAPGVLGAVPAAALQDGDDMVGERCQLVGQR